MTTGVRKTPSGPKARTDQDRQGFTLVELLVTLFIMGLALSALYATFRAQHSSYYRQSDIQQMQQTSHSLLVMLKKDLLQAGYGVHKSLGLYIRDGAGTNSSDALLINDYDFFLDDESRLFQGRYGQSKIVSGSGGSSIQMETLDIDDEGGSEFLPDRFILTDDGADKYAKIDSIGGNTLTLDRTVAGTYAAPAVHYAVDHNSHELLKTDSGSPSVALASNIYDLQVAYVDESGTWYCDGSGTGEMSPFDPEEIALIRLSIVVGTRTWREVLNPNTVSAENGPVWKGEDQDPEKSFRVYTISLVPRNFLF